MISVIILGSGNVATHLFNAFDRTNNIVVNQWFNRSLDSIEQYKAKVAITNNLGDLKEADIYILAVSDDAIHEISTKFPFTNKFVVHTSGALKLHEMDKKMIVVYFIRYKPLVRK